MNYPQGIKEKFEILSSTDREGVVDVLYMTSIILECPTHGVRKGDGLYCKCCGQMLHYSVLKGKFNFGCVYVEPNSEVESV